MSSQHQPRTSSIPYSPWVSMLICVCFCVLVSVTLIIIAVHLQTMWSVDTAPCANISYFIKLFPCSELSSSGPSDIYGGSRWVFHEQGNTEIATGVPIVQCDTAPTFGQHSNCPRSSKCLDPDSPRSPFFCPWVSNLNCVCERVFVVVIIIQLLYLNKPCGVECESPLVPVFYLWPLNPLTFMERLRGVA
jgi:hypothetical protein